MKKKDLEQGSEFQWLAPNYFANVRNRHPWLQNGLYLGSGRDAFRILIRKGKKRGWKRIYLPSYYCSEVAESIKSENIGIAYYEDDPCSSINAPKIGDGDVLLVVNTFGIRERWNRPSAGSGTIIEDHTHDPWSFWAKNSEADYCLASLRKTLPVPDGAVIWSPRRHQLPARIPLTPFHYSSSTKKLQAMLIKSLYLEGWTVDKNRYLNLYKEGELRIANRCVSGISEISSVVIDYFPVDTWREKRNENAIAFRQEMSGIKDVSVLSARDPGSCPFSCVIVCGNEELRNHIRSQLIRANIYPAILWAINKPVNKIRKSGFNFSRRMLSIHCDGRYDTYDMKRTTRVIKDILGNT